VIGRCADERPQAHALRAALDIGWLVLTRLREDVPAAERTRLARSCAATPATRGDHGEGPRRPAQDPLHVDLKKIGRDAALRQMPFGGMRRH
jgi:hypothetical protein